MIDLQNLIDMISTEATEAIEESRLIDQMNKEASKNARTIIIATKRFFNDKRYAHLFPEDSNYWAHVSDLGFSHPVQDFKGNENAGLSLRTVLYKGNKEDYWIQTIDDENGFVLGNQYRLNPLLGSFTEYSPEHLREWQQMASERHRLVLNKMEDLYYQEKLEISKDFLKELFRK